VRSPALFSPGGHLLVIEPSHAVFLSDASEDAQAAQRICEALRPVGIEIRREMKERIAKCDRNRSE